MKAILATAAGVLVLGGVFLASSGRTTSAQAAPPAIMAAANGPALVNCGEGRQAVVHASDRGPGLAQVECVAPGQAGTSAADPYARPFPTIDNGTPLGYAQPASQLAPVAPMPTAPVVKERIVYRDRPVTRSTARSATPYRRASTVNRTRTWKKSAVIIGGSTAGGAGLGAVLGGKGGAKKGAVVGLVGGTIYDIATRKQR